MSKIILESHPDQNEIFRTFTPSKVLHFSTYMERKRAITEGEFVIQPKYDGWYVFCFCTSNGFSSFFSSTRRPIPAFEHIRNELNRKITSESDLRAVEGIYILEADIPYIKEFYRKNGIFNRQEPASDVIFWLVDFIPKSSISWLHSYNLAFEARISLLNDPLDVFHSRGVGELFQTIDGKYISSLLDSEIESEFEKEVSSDGEGIVIRNLRAPFSPGKRSSANLKLKAEETFEQKIINFYTTTGAKGNTGYSLDVLSHDNITNTVVINSHKLIENFLRESPVGKIAEISCMEVFPGGKFRQPVFKAIRTNKTFSDDVLTRVKQKRD